AGLERDPGAPLRLSGGGASVPCAVAELGQGFVTLASQIARTVLGCDAVVEPAGTAGIDSAGSSSASRQTWMSGGAVLQAAREGAVQGRSAVGGRPAGVAGG